MEEMREKKLMETIPFRAAPTAVGRAYSGSEQGGLTVHSGARLLELTLVSVALALGGCARTPPPEQVAGETRIAVLSPAVADLLVDLGLGDSIVARHAFDRFLAQELPTVGDQAGIDYERLLRVRPTHVLLEWGSRDPPERLVQLGVERGWVVLDLRLLSLQDIRDATAALGEMFDRAPEAEAMLARMDEAWSVRAGLRERAGRTLPLYWTDPIGVAGPGSFHHQVLEALGVTLAITEGSAYIQMDPEDLRRLNPDSIVLFSPGMDASGLAAALAPLERLELHALRAGRVVLINHPKGQTPSAAMVGVAEQAAAGLARLGAAREN